jgi:hypothetical protein
MNAHHSPLFVVGVDRSGTTLLSLMLDSHSRLAIPYESHFFVPFYQKQDTFGDLASRECRARLVEEILAEPYVQQWDGTPAIEDVDLDKCGSLSGAINEVYSAYARRRGKDLWGDKTPAYTGHVHILDRLFPDARYVHIIRDGRDVALSITQQWWGIKDFASALGYWRQLVETARGFLRTLPAERFVELRFEDLVADPERELRRIAALLRVDFEPTMIDGYRANASQKVGKRIDQQHVHLKRAPSTDQCYKWKASLPEADRAIAHEIAGSLFRDLGYASGVADHRLKMLGTAIRRIGGACCRLRHWPAGR